MSISDYRMTLGGDPEILLTSGKSKGSAGHVIYARDVLDESKTGGGNITYDGMIAEINVIPDTCRERLIYNYSDILNNIFTQADSGKFDLLTSPAGKVKKSVLESVPDQDKIFGCDPDVNAYTGKKNKVTISGLKHQKRYGGGHLHFGISSPITKTFYRNNISLIIKLMDYICGNTCVLLDRDPANAVRRKVYGKAGSYRIQPHGIEYRVLSNFWLRGPQLVSIVYKLGRVAINVAADCRIRENEEAMDFVDYIFDKIPEQKVVDAINNNDFNKAAENAEIIIPELISIGGISMEFWTPVQYLIERGIDNILGNMRNEWKNHENGVISWWRRHLSTISDDIEAVILDTYSATVKNCILKDLYKYVSDSLHSALDRPLLPSPKKLCGINIYEVNLPCDIEISPDNIPPIRENTRRER
ncbi:MAG: hypothetical protein DRP74_07590 [Candidatus Omnitrophota bacterium]|nr:MAG: hypothetical protein DRP74_07590 [Candidatus Omnitrophota bacterium]